MCKDEEKSVKRGVRLDKKKKMTTEHNHTAHEGKKPVLISMDGSEHADYAFHCKCYVVINVGACKLQIGVIDACCCKIKQNRPSI